MKHLPNKKSKQGWYKGFPVKRAGILKEGRGEVKIREGGNGLLEVCFSGI